ncbi:MAG: glutathione S-transferase family protein [Alphaproteobacteria bacterium]|nr:glutathione S-transferase family protein [Alphaproteobacteria bacterium]
MSAYKLFYSPGACSMAVHICLLECGQNPEIVNADLHNAAGRNADFVKSNPRGQVPVVVEDGQVIREGAAQMIYLLDKFSSPLMPKSGIERARALEWLCWGNATLHPAYSKAFGAKKISDDANVQEMILASAFKGIQKLWDEAETVLSKQKYLAGDQPTMGDILMTVIANWNSYFPGKINLGPNVKRVLKEMVARPAYQKALAAEQVEYKAAA